jgi:hypothetical protein
MSRFGKDEKPTSPFIPRCTQWDSAPYVAWFMFRVDLNFNSFVAWFMFRVDLKIGERKLPFDKIKHCNNGRMPYFNDSLFLKLLFL